MKPNILMAKLLQLPTVGNGGNVAKDGQKVEIQKKSNFVNCVAE